MNFGPGVSPIWGIFDLGDVQLMYILLLARKLGSRAKKCIFLRYPKGSKGYVFLGENDDGTRTEIESQNANFLEHKFPSIGETSRDVEFFEEEDEPVPVQEGVEPLVSGR